MRLAVLFSGGKDSYLALQYASIDHEISCLLTLESQNDDSWMFHTPAIEWTKLQAKSMEFSHIVSKPIGVKEKELDDLHSIIMSAVLEYSIEGIVTGAIASVYQSTRIQRICNALDLWCFNPLWQMSQRKLLEKLFSNKIISIITGVAAEPFSDNWRGRTIDSKCVKELISLESKYGINPAGEGGEIESFVINAPLFQKPINIVESRKHYSNFSGRLEIMEAFLE